MMSLNCPDILQSSDQTQGEGKLCDNNKAVKSSGHRLSLLLGGKLLEKERRERGQGWNSEERDRAVM